MIGVLFFQILILFLIIFSPLILGTIFLGWQKKIKVKHNESGIQKNCFIGYSWTYFFFGFFVLCDFYVKALKNIPPCNTPNRMQNSQWRSY